MLAGIDAGANIRHSINWESILKLSLLYATDVAEGERFVGIPPNQFSYSLAYTKATVGRFKSLNAGLEAAYTFRQYLAPEVISPDLFLPEGGLDPESFDPPASGFDFKAAPNGYLLFNLASGIERGRLSYRLRVRNLLNTSYRSYTNRMRYFADEQGINFILSVKYSF